MARLPEGYEVVETKWDDNGMIVTINITDKALYDSILAGTTDHLSLPGPSPVQTDPRETDDDTAGQRTGTSRGLRAPRSDG